MASSIQNRSLRKSEEVHDSEYSNECLSLQERGRGVDIYYYKNHIAVDVWPIKNKNDKKSFRGFYFSFGGNATIQADKDQYGEPAIFSLDLPESMTYAKLNQLNEPHNDTYARMSHNCADAALEFLRDQLGFESLNNIKTRLATTPKFIAEQACYLALKQNENSFKEVLELKEKRYDDNEQSQRAYYRALKNGQNSFKGLEKKYDIDTIKSLNNFRAIIQLETEKLEIKKALIKIKAAGLSWDSLNIVSKAYHNVMQSVRTKLIDTKYNYLIKLKEDVDTSIKEVPNLASVEKIFNDLNKIYSLNKNSSLKTMIDNFPYHLLPDSNKKLNFLRSIQNSINKNENDFKRQKFFGNSLPKGVLQLKEKLQVIKPGTTLSNVEIQKLFYEVQDILKEKYITNASTSTRSAKMQQTYKNAYEYSKNLNLFKQDKQQQKSDKGRGIVPAHCNALLR